MSGNTATILQFSIEEYHVMTLSYDPQRYRYASKRHLTYARKGIVCTAQPLAAQAGLRMLQMGGNAVDAAIATAICLTVVEPTSNGLGSDCFAQIWTQGALYGLNGSGYAPGRLTIEAVNAGGYRDTMPTRGWRSVTIPGAPDAWATMHKRFGKLPFATLFEPAIDYAQNGFVLSPTTARFWREGFDALYRFRHDDAVAPWFDVFAAAGSAPRAGDVVRLPYHARTLEALAQSECDAFYRGDIAQAICDFSNKTGGFIDRDDLAQYGARWVEPIKVNYRGYEVCELPPNGHGIVALMALNILSEFELKKRDDISTFHAQIEAMKCAFADGMAYVADPRYMKTPVESLLSIDYARMRRKHIGNRALAPCRGTPFSGGTVYVAAADDGGNMVSLIQSGYKDFGSGVVVPHWGINFNDRAAGFSLDARSDNALMPRKLPYHTIIPGFLLKDGRPVGPFGVMGAYMQPQGHVQVVSNLIDFGLNPQEALDAPRWQWIRDKTVAVESGVDRKIVNQLRRRGHDVVVMRDDASFGRGQIAFRCENGALVGASEPRADACCAAW